MRNSFKKSVDFFINRVLWVVSPSISTYFEHSLLWLLRIDTRLRLHLSRLIPLSVGPEVRNETKTTPTSTNQGTLPIFWSVTDLGLEKSTLTPVYTMSLCLLSLSFVLA